MFQSSAEEDEVTPNWLHIWSRKLVELFVVLHCQRQLDVELIIALRNWFKESTFRKSTCKGRDSPYSSYSLGFRSKIMSSHNILKSQAREPYQQTSIHFLSSQKIIKHDSPRINHKRLQKYIYEVHKLKKKMKKYKKKKRGMNLEKVALPFPRNPQFKQ